MKKTIFYIIIFILSLFSSCGNVSQHARATSEAKKNYSITQLTDGINIDGVNNFSYCGDNLILTGYITETKLNDSGDIVDVRKNTVIIFDVDGNVLNEFSIDSDISSSNAYIDDDGSITFLFAEFVHNENQNATEYVNRIESYNTEGELIIEVLLDYSEFTLFSSQITRDGNGYYYILAADVNNIRRLWIFDENGNEIGRLNAPGQYQIMNIFSLNDGRIFTRQSKMNGKNAEFIFVEIDSRSFRFTNEYRTDGAKINVSNENGIISDDLILTDGNEEFDILLRSYFGVYGYNFNTGVSTEMIDWQEAGINPGLSMPKYSIFSDNGIYCIEGEYKKVGLKRETENVKLLKLTETEPITETNKKVIKMAAVYTPDNVKRTVDDFNNNNNDCHIEINDYADGELTENSYAAALNKLNADISAGNYPDIIAINGNMPIFSYISKGVLEDLYNYINNDPDIDCSDYMPNALKALENNGKLFTVAESFQIETVIGKTSDVGANMGWTWEEYNKLIESRPDGTVPVAGQLGDMSKRSFLLTMLRPQMSDYINYEDGACDFMNSGFIDVLVTANNYPASSEQFEEDSFKNGDPILMRVDFGGFSQLPEYETINFGEDVAFKGFPSDNTDEIGSYYEFFNEYAVCSYSDAKDEAFSFIKYLLTDRQENDDALRIGLPIRISSLERLAENAKFIYGEEEYIFRNGVQIKARNNNENDNQKIFNLINSANKRNNFDIQIWNIIADEAEAYFNGAKSAEKAADIIQNRISLYISETK